MRKRRHYIFPVLILLAVSCGSEPEPPPVTARAVRAKRKAEKKAEKKAPKRRR